MEGIVVNFDHTYKLDVVKKLFNDVKSEINWTSCEKRMQDINRSNEHRSHFNNGQCNINEAKSSQNNTDSLSMGVNINDYTLDTTSKQIKVKFDFAVLVVHAHESRLNINEENAGIGYYQVYQTLKELTGNKVILIIGGDDKSKDEDSISLWVLNKIYGQFTDDYIYGHKGLVMSWDACYSQVHKEKLQQFLKLTASNKNEVTNGTEEKSSDSSAEIAQLNKSCTNILDILDTF